MRFEEARFTEPSFTTRVSERKETTDSRRSAHRSRWSQRRRRFQINLASSEPLNDETQLQQKRFDSDGECPMPPAFLCYQIYCKRCFVIIGTVLRSSSARTSIAGIKSSTDGSLCGLNEQDYFASGLAKSGTVEFQEFFVQLPGRDVAASTMQFHNFLDFGIDNYHPKHNDVNANDREFLAGLVCSTALCVKIHDYHHEAQIAWTHSMENPQYRGPSTKKEEEETKNAITIVLSGLRNAICLGTKNIDVEVLFSMETAKQEPSVLEDDVGTGTSLKISVRTQKCRAAYDVASADLLNVTYSSTLSRHFPYDMLDNTAFNDDYDNENKDDYGDNDDDYNRCNGNDYDGEFKDCMYDGYCHVWHGVDRLNHDTPGRATANREFRPERTRIALCLWSLVAHEMSWMDAEEEESFNRHDKNIHQKVFEANACVDVLGGEPFTVLRPSRSFTICRTTFTEYENNIVFFTKNRHPVLVGEMSTDSNDRNSGRPHDQEKWKMSRSRRSRKHTEIGKGYIDVYRGGDHGLLENDNDNEYCNRIEERNDYTARSRKPITSGKGKRCERQKWYKPFSEKLAERKVQVFTKCRGNADGYRRGIRQEGGKNKETGSERRRGARSYGLLFSLYLLALPILCSTDSLAPMALSFAQKSPLTHGDNYTVRNSSLQHQGYQMRRDGVHDSSHPYNEYTWEVNQINPWLSACDLAGPAPADLQGTCGPPEVPKNCPLPCASMSQGDINQPFFEVIKRLRTRNRAKNGANKPGWQPAGMTTANKRNKDKDEDGNTRSEEAVMAPEQCLFYLEESHKRDICQDNFGRGSSLSFSNSRENRYWFVSGLRLRHCCEHAVINALAPGKGGPLEDVLNGGRKCADALDKLLLVDGLAARLHCEFEEVLARYDCAQPYSVIHNCTHCKEAYRKWVCSSLVPYFAHGGPPALETSMHAWSGLRLRPCRSFCQSVEQRCPYLLPGDRAPAYPTQYAGEPTFLCRDPNIPETGEQALRALHGNEEEECCFHVCSEDEPGLGVCTNCIDWEPHSHRAGHDTPSAPHCEITTSSIQSSSTGHEIDAELSGSSNDAESAFSNPSPLTTTSASFCGSGGVGSMSSSSGQSTAPSPPSSVSLIYLFWIWAALMSLYTGQTVFLWASPALLLMLDLPSTIVVATLRRTAEPSRFNVKNSNISIFSKNAQTEVKDCKRLVLETPKQRT